MAWGVHDLMRIQNDDKVKSAVFQGFAFWIRFISGCRPWRFIARGICQCGRITVGSSGKKYRRWRGSQIFRGIPQKKYEEDRIQYFEILRGDHQFSVLCFIFEATIKFWCTSVNFDVASEDY